MRRRFFLRRGNLVATSVVLMSMLFIIDIGIKANAQNQKKNEIKEVENFNRPEPSRPIRPEVPGTNRYQEDKVFLEYADSLYKLKNNRFDTVERQILKGNVKFRQAGLWMFCDSAYYYPEKNSLDAFSNVRMEQGDTLFVYADQLFYDGDLHLAKLKNGPTREKVTLINKDVTLTTDSLDYDMSIDLGWYSRWGTIDDKVNELTSLYGEYSPKTKRAEFFTDVVLINKKDGFTMLTDTLYYSTQTHVANIESKTLIQSENDTIVTNLATYYTDTGDADLLSRSLIIHRDSTGNVTTLEGDSIIYDNATRISRAYMYQDPFKHSTPMVITDTAQKTTLIGGFGIYNDSTKEALATIYPLLMEYSQKDTLFLRADTILTYIVTEMIPDKRRKTKSGYPESNGVPIVIADSTGLWIDSAYFAVSIPYVETPLVMLLKAAPPLKQEDHKVEEAIEELKIPTSPSDKEENNEDNSDIIIENIEIGEIPESDNEIISEDDDNPENTLKATGNIKNFIDSLSTKVTSELIGIEDMDSVSLDSAKLIERLSILDSLNYGDSLLLADSVVLTDTIEPKEEVDSVPYQYHVIEAYHRGRFFKQDMQGVADSMVFVEKDSMLYLFRKPIVWSGERQVTGNRIDVHFNDSTTDWAYLPEYGLMSELVEEDFYNQIFGKEITAYFENQGLRRMSISGNVETIFLPQEEDSTYNRLVNAESSYMEVYLSENKLDWLKMWPEVSGEVTPIFLVKRNQMYLQKFKWWGFLRPEREWYGDRIRWADNLGEVPDELDQYFLTPSDFGEPKSFPATRGYSNRSLFSIWNDMPAIEMADSLNSVSSELDSLIVNNPEMVAPDSIQTGIDSPGVIEAEKTETIEEIEKENEEEEEKAEEIIQQLEGIIEEEKSGISEEEQSTEPLEEPEINPSPENE